MFLVAVGFWNFLGAGIFGFLINLPIVSYYEIGTALTANHGHAAMMGVYGMLAVGLALFCLRYLIPADRWPERAAKLELLVTQHRPRLDVLSDSSRSGFIQLYKSVNNGYFHARSLDFLTNSTQHGDRVDAASRRRSVHRRRRAPLLYICWIGVRHRVKRPRRSTSPRTSSSPTSPRRPRRRSMSPEAESLGAAYAGLLLVAALGLDHLARHTHHRSGRVTGQRDSRTAAELDAWVCPEGEHLKPVETDHRSRVARYRARAAICNSARPRTGAQIPIRAARSCASSTPGRTQRQVDSTAGSPWRSLVSRR